MTSSRIPALSASRRGWLGHRIAVAAEQHAAHLGEDTIVEFGQRADLLQRIEQLELAALAELAEQRLRRAPAHRAESVEETGRMAAERLTEQTFGLGRQVSERKILGGPLDLGEIGASSTRSAV